MNYFQHLFCLDKKVALVTGGAGILGSVFCRALCEFNATVICIDKSKELPAELFNEIDSRYQDNLVFYSCDITDPASVNDTIDEIINRYSKIDVLINNAATKTNELKNFFSPVLEFSIETWREVMAVNIDAMFLMAQAVGKRMVENRHGSIVQIGSIYGLFGPDQRIYEESEYLGCEINTPAVYTTSKAAVVGLTKHLAALWGQYGVRVNTLCPGGVSSGQNKKFNMNYAARVPMGRMATSKDIVGPMLFLASEASSYLTGQTIYVDGGLTAW